LFAFKTEIDSNPGDNDVLERKYGIICENYLKCAKRNYKVHCSIKNKMDNRGREAHKIF
jgi:hypothetical protein